MASCSICPSEYSPHPPLQLSVRVLWALPVVPCLLLLHLISGVISPANTNSTTSSMLMKHRSLSTPDLLPIHIKILSCFSDISWLKILNLSPQALPATSSLNLCGHHDPACHSGIFNSAFSPGPSIQAISKSSRFSLCNISKAWPFLSSLAAKTVIEALIILHLDYCNILFSDLDRCNLAPFISTQNVAAKIIFLAIALTMDPFLCISPLAPPSELHQT